MEQSSQRSLYAKSKQKLQQTMNTSASQHWNICVSARGRRQSRKLTPTDKFRAVKRIQNGETKASVSRDIGVPESTLRGWCKNEKKIRFMCTQIGSATFKNVPSSTMDCSQPARKKNKYSAHPFTIGNKFLSGIASSENITKYATSPSKCYLNKNNSAAPKEETKLTEFTMTGPKTKFQANIHNIYMPEGKQDLPQLSPSSLRATDLSRYSSAYWNQSGFIQNYFNQLFLLNAGLMPIVNENLNGTTNYTKSFASNWKEVKSKSNLIQESLPPLKNSLNISHNKDTGDHQRSPIIQRNGWGSIDLTSGNPNDLTNEEQQVTSDKHLNNEVITNNIYKTKNNHGTCDTTTNQWCKMFNASLNFFTLAATVATIQSSALYLQGVNGTNSKIKHMNIERKKVSTPAFGNSIQNFWNNNCIEVEPEDLSVRSTITKISTPQDCNLQSQIKSIK